MNGCPICEPKKQHEFPRFHRMGSKIFCQACNAMWCRERYSRWKVWATVRADGKKERR